MFAWEYVNMVVASRCFAFRMIIMQAWIWKNFLVEHSTILRNIYPFPRRLKLGKSLQNMLCQFFFSLNMSWHFKWEKSIFWNTSFLQNKNWLHKQDFMYKTSWLVRISLLISVITKSVTFFLSITWYKHKRGWENSLQLCKPWTSSQVCIAISDSPNPSRAYIRPCKYREKVFYCSRSSL